ncbi:NOL1 NOP2 sun family protein [Rutstroemia sp. NJR-2017a BBW]|nr:NOL1 NOP2 sun family protein [Rutstroemia sp. NJR-2017a BBW]
MSLYYEAADVLTAPTNKGGSLKSRVYALAIETCKWSPVLKEVIENADILRLERKLTPILSLLLVHDFLLAKKGIALPATHGLRTSVERHKGRLQAELTKARLRRKLSTMEALKAHIESGLENASDEAEAPYPRWVRINTLKTTLEDQLDTTFADYERAATIDSVRRKGSKKLYIDVHIPNLVAISPSVDLIKSEAYKSGAIIFQDKASCFPAYLLDPLPEDGDIIDSCSAPGNKTTHIAAILVDRLPEPDESTQVIHAFEKNNGRAETLEKMVNLAGSNTFTTLHAGQDFLKTDPNATVYKKVGALLLDPSCSGSGIVGRDDMPELHLPVLSQAAAAPSSKNRKKAKKGTADEESGRKRKREEEEEALEMVDDDGVVTAVDTDAELKSRLSALAEFQLELLLHAFKYPAARKITYSTCSIHAEENESVVRKALESSLARERGWKILKRDEQIRGMREWPVRGSAEACEGDHTLSEACIRANKGDENGTMGFFLAGFVRSQPSTADPETEFLRDERGHLVRDVMGFPVRRLLEDEERMGLEGGDNHPGPLHPPPQHEYEEEEEWGGLEDDDTAPNTEAVVVEPPAEKKGKPKLNKHTPDAIKRRVDLGVRDKKRRKAKR